MYIEPEDHLIGKTYMTRVEGENTRLRHYLGGAYAPDKAELGTGRIRVRITPQNSLLFQISSIAQVFSPLTIALFKIWHASIFSLKHYAPTNAN